MLVHSHRIHSHGILTCSYHKNQLNVGKYASPMDPMGFVLLLFSLLCVHWVSRTSSTFAAKLGVGLMHEVDECVGCG